MPAPTQHTEERNGDELFLQQSQEAIQHSRELQSLQNLEVEARDVYQALMNSAQQQQELWLTLEQQLNEVRLEEAVLWITQMSSAEVTRCQFEKSNMLGNKTSMECELSDFTSSFENLLFSILQVQPAGALPGVNQAIRRIARGITITEDTGEVCLYLKLRKVNDRDSFFNIKGKYERKCVKRLGSTMTMVKIDGSCCKVDKCEARVFVPVKEILSEEDDNAKKLITGALQKNNIVTTILNHDIICYHWRGICQKLLLLHLMLTFPFPLWLMIFAMFAFVAHSFWMETLTVRPTEVKQKPNEPRDAL